MFQNFRRWSTEQDRTRLSPKIFTPKNVLKMLHLDICLNNFTIYLATNNIHWIEG